MSSYNRFNNNFFYDSLVVCLTSCGTAILAGFAIFTIVGHMAFKLGKPVHEVVESGIICDWFILKKTVGNCAPDDHLE